MLIKKAWFVKEWNIFQVNDLYKVEEQKFELMTTILLRKIWDSTLSLRYLGKRKEWVRDTILIKIHKDGSVLESRIENVPKITINTIRYISKSNSAKYYEVRLFWSKRIVEKKLTSRKKLKWIRKDSFTKQSIINGIILVVLICYLRRIQV